MKSIFVSLLMLWGCTAVLQAQGYYDSQRKWTKGPLTWNEFKGRVDNDTSIVKLEWTWSSEAKTEKVHGRRYTYAAICPAIDLTESWGRGNFHNESTLKFCQTAFDLMELYCRQMTADYAASPKGTDPQLMFRYYRNQYNRQMDQMYVETRQGQDETAVDLAATRVALELEQTHFDPSAVVLGERTRRIDVAMGYCAVPSLNDVHTSMSSGGDMMLGYGWSRHYAFYDLSFAFGGKSQLDIKTTDGNIYENDQVNAMRFTLDYGYRINSSVERPLYPYVGLGMSTLKGPNIEGFASGKTKPNEKDGFLLTAGMIYDLPITRHYWLKSYSGGMWGSNEANNTLGTFTIRLKPSLQLAHYSDIGWKPSLHLSVMINLGTVEFDKKR